MARRNLTSHSFSRADRPAGRRGRLAPFGLFVVATCVAVLRCGGQLPGAPDAIPLLTISGYVYEQGTPNAGEPLLSNVLITVQEAEGPSHTATTDGAGFYTISVRAGAISISASKVGFVTRRSRFDMSKSTVLNFTLIPT
jgi:Carboxypeptidase regulatory-like domain